MKTRIISTNKTAYYIIALLVILIAFLLLGGGTWLKGLTYSHSSNSMAKLHWLQIIIGAAIGFLAGILVLIMLSLISMHWNISSHMAGLGALTGVAVSVMLRFGVYNPAFFAAVILAGGLTGFSRLVLEKNSPAQIYAGYVLGFGILFLVYSLI